MQARLPHAFKPYHPTLEGRLVHEGDRERKTDYFVGWIVDGDAALFGVGIVAVLMLLPVYWAYKIVTTFPYATIATVSTGLIGWIVVELLKERREERAARERAAQRREAAVKVSAPVQAPTINRRVENVDVSGTRIVAERHHREHSARERRRTSIESVQERQAREYARRSVAALPTSVQQSLRIVYVAGGGVANHYSNAIYKHSRNAWVPRAWTSVAEVEVVAATLRAAYPKRRYVVVSVDGKILLAETRF